MSRLRELADRLVGGRLAAQRVAQREVVAELDLRPAPRVGLEVRLVDGLRLEVILGDGVEHPRVERPDLPAAGVVGERTRRWRPPRAFRQGVGEVALVGLGVAELLVEVAGEAGEGRQVSDLALGPDVGEEARAVDDLHREEAVLRLDEELVEVDQVRVRDVREGPELALEAVERVGVGVRQGLEGDGPIAPAVVGLEDDTHGACAEASADLKAIDRARAGILLHRLGWPVEA